MGTRADFYIGRDPATMEWLGSIGWDGYPDGTPEPVLNCKTEQAFKEAVEFIRISEGSDFTTPAQGWPWPWNDSGTSDYAYAFENGEVYYTVGDNWWKHSDGPEPDDEPNDPCAKFPDMTARKNVRLDGGSGMIIISR